MPDNYHLSDIYQGGYSTLDPESGFVGYRIGAGKLGLAGDPRTANILQEVSTRLQTGAKQIEISPIQPGVFESIPNQQLKEVKRLSELTGIDVSVHAPLIEASGISQQGVYNELARDEAERQMSLAVERSHELDRKGNIPVTFHSSVNVPGPEYRITEVEGKRVEEKALMPIINQETGQTIMVKADKRYSPGMKELEKGEMYTVERQLNVRNSTEWSDAITNLVAIKERADRMISDTEQVVVQTQKKMQEQGIGYQNLTPMEQDVLNRYQNAGLELAEIHKHLSNLFERAYKYGEGGKMVEENKVVVELKKEDYKRRLAEFSEEFGKVVRDEKGLSLSEQSRAMEELMKDLNKLPPPLLFKPVEEFATEKTATTFANAAFNAYKKFGTDAPIVSIENPPAGLGLSRGGDLKKVVEVAREKFADRAEREGMNRKEAERQAAKLIGVTWDVGHINMLRKYGYTEEDIIKESEKVAPLVKHVHLSDNFGFEHTELPMGMGNVPIKQIMEKLGQKGFEARKIIEAGNWWEHFKTSPFQQTLEAFGSPIYGIIQQPYWNQAIGMQGYFSGFGNMLPQFNYEQFGSGFSSLPAELGGQRQTGQSRMTGRPLE